MLAGLGDRSDGIARQCHGYERGGGKLADQCPYVGREKPRPHRMVNGVGCLGEGGVPVVVQPGEERRVRAGGDQGSAAPSEGRQSLQPVPGTGGHQVVGKPFCSVLCEVAWAAVGAKAKPGQSLVDRLMADIVGAAAFMVQPRGDEVVQFNREFVTAYRAGQGPPGPAASFPSASRPARYPRGLPAWTG